MSRTLAPTDADGVPIDMAAWLYTWAWLDVLAMPDTYRALQRPIDAAAKAVLLTLLDVWIAYVERGDWYFDGPPEEERAPLARRLRDLLEAWVPPELPAEITEAARAVLDAEGIKKWRLEQGVDWNDLVSRGDRSRTVDSQLLWPEGLAQVWPKRGATDEERAERQALRYVQIFEWLAQCAAKDRSEHAARCTRRIHATLALAQLLASPRAMREIGELPSHEEVLERWDDLKSIIAGLSTEPRGDARRLLALDPHVDRLRALCESWTPSADVPSEIQRAARDFLAAFDIPEPPVGGDPFEGEPDAGPS